MFSRECSVFYSVRHDPFLLDTTEPEKVVAGSAEVPEVSTQDSTQARDPLVYMHEASSAASIIGNLSVHTVVHVP